MTTHTHTRANGSDVNARINEAKRAFTDAAHKVRQTADSVTEKVMHDAKARSKEARSQVAAYVKKKPLAALGGAVAVGFILSWLVRR